MTDRGLKVTKYAREILKYLTQTHSGLQSVKPPEWLSKARWRPDLCLSTPPARHIQAVDIVPSGAIPRTIYRKEVGPLLRKHADLRVVVCVLEEGFEKHPDIEDFCRGAGVGLKVLISGLGLETVVRTDLDPTVSVASISEEDGWFPKAILGQATGLRRLRFSRQIDAFIEKVAPMGNDKRGVHAPVSSTIDALMQEHPAFRRNTRQFMQLKHFEDLFELSSSTASEHVFHSFRVFLAGCPVVNQFYDTFRGVHTRFCGGNRAITCVEYAWLLASVFHDVGYPKVRAPKLVEEELADEDMEIRVVGKDTRWVREEYRTARRTLGSFAAYVANYPGNGGWDLGAIEDAKGKELGIAWTQLYNTMSSHAVVGALDFLARVFKTATAARERANRPFVLSHAVPAALAILHHDWRIWEHAKRWKLFPIDASAMPMAALLIYLDTWDDYKRKGPDPTISVSEYLVDSDGVQVTIDWADSKLLEEEQKKYKAFKSALQNKPFSMTIKPRMAGAA